MTVRCTVCGEDFATYTANDEICPCCAALEGDFEVERTCVICGGSLSPIKRKYCSVGCRQEGTRRREAEKRRKLADPFADYDRACIAARERGEHLSYGKFSAAKYAAKDIKIGG